MTTEKQKLRVSDIVPFDKHTYEETHKTIKELDNLAKEYRGCYDNPHELERIKREFLGYLSYFATLYAKVKPFKGSTHVYLDEQRKRCKAECIEILLSEKFSATNAANIVYSHPYYVERIRLMEDIKQFFILTENLYELYNMTFNSIVQSISVASKEMHNTKQY